MFVNPVAIRALQNMLTEIEQLISHPRPSLEQRTASLELLQAAKALTNNLMPRGTRIQ